MAERRTDIRLADYDTMINTELEEVQKNGGRNLSYEERRELVLTRLRERGDRFCILERWHKKVEFVARQMWENEHMPEGRHSVHWYAAEKIVLKLPG